MFERTSALLHGFNFIKEHPVGISAALYFASLFLWGLAGLFVRTRRFRLVAMSVLVGSASVLLSILTAYPLLRDQDAVWLGTAAFLLPIVAGGIAGLSASERDRR
jgi:hypothetical protein